MWFALSIILVAFAAVAFLVVLHLWFWGLYYRPDENGVDEVHYARTTDGWRLAVHRYKGTDETRAQQPVILCHGLAANRFTFDITPELSLARYLRRQGWDVWVVELRGVGMSTRPIPMGGRRWSWTFDEHIKHDIPAAIDYVCETTRAPAVHWVGHSLGGILMYAWLQGIGALKVRSCTTIGSTAFYESSDTLNLVTRLQKLASYLPVLRLRFLSKMAAPFYVPVRLSLVGANGANVDGNVMRKVMTHLVTDVCGNVVRQLAHWVRSGTFKVDEVDYQAGISRIRTPMLVLAGEVDTIAPPKECRRIIEAVNSEERQFHVLGKRFGQGEDYGHGDLLFGKRCRTEVFPVLSEWLEERSRDAMPPPVPDTTVAIGEPLPHGRLTPREVDDLPRRPLPSALPGPFGLLTRYSPTRRVEWLEQRRSFRHFEETRWSQLAAGIDPDESHLSLRSAQARQRNPSMARLLTIPPPGSFLDKKRAVDKAEEPPADEIEDAAELESAEELESAAELESAEEIEDDADE